MHANKRTELEEASAGEIVALAGLKITTTGETLCLEHRPIIYDLMEFLSQLSLSQLSKNKYR